MDKRARNWNYLYLLVSIFFISLILSFPKLPIKFNLWGWAVDTTLEAPQLNFNVFGNPAIKDLKPQYGLEFGGGYRLILNLDVEGVDKVHKTYQLSKVEYELTNRAYEVGLSDFQMSSSIEEDNYKLYLDAGVYEDFQKIFLIATTGELSFKQLSEENRQTDNPEIFNNPDSYVDTQIEKKDFDKARVTKNPETGDPSIQLIFTEEGLEKFRQVAVDNVGYPVAIMIDNSIISAPTISENFLLGEISNPVISGGFEIEYAKILATVINSGELSYQISMETTEFIEPYWKTDIITKALVLIGIGFLLTSAYVFYKYRKFGFIFLFSIIFNFVLSTALVRFGFPSVLKWVFSGELGELFFEPMIVTTATLAGWLIANLILIKMSISCFILFQDSKKISSEEFIEANVKKAKRQNSLVWIFTLLIAIIMGWFGPGRSSALGQAIGLFSLVSLLTFNTLTVVLINIFNRFEQNK